MVSASNSAKWSARIRERVVDHLAHIDTKLAEAVGANLGIELSDDQRNITLPAPVNGVEKTLASASTPMPKEM